VGASRVRVAYIVDGNSYEANAPVKMAATITLAAPIIIRYLPESPRVIWVGDPPTEEDIAHELVGAKVMLLATIVLYGLMITVLIGGFVARRRRLAKDQSAPSLEQWVSRFRRRLSLAMIVVWFLLTWIIIEISFLDPRIRAVHEKAFGGRPLGLLQELVITAVHVILCLPFLWILWRFRDRLISDLLRAIPAGHAVKQRWQAWKSTLILLGELFVYMFLLLGIWCAYLGFLGVKLPLS
jgi:hypothetical protein